MDAILQKESLGRWIAKLQERGEVYAPEFVEDAWEFTKVERGASVELDHTNTVLPAKGFVFPQREVLYRFRIENGKTPELTDTELSVKPMVVFGVRPCDGRATVRNDRVFTCGVSDPYYQARRDSVVFIGLACNAPPSPNCFCVAVGGSPCSEDGLDVLMTDLDGRYHVKALTDKGRDVVNAASDLFQAATAADRNEVSNAQVAALEYPQRSISAMDLVVAALKRNFESPLWDQLARTCIGCGACTYLCPTCHCFDINDEVTSKSPLTGARVRTWDNCQFPDFTMHSSGHNPREDTGARLRQRICHKLLYFVETHNMQQCTGCGRCITHCPVGIDIVRIANVMEEGVWQ
ncbi:4Fe-4S dicluster domain-containing protein [Blastochloris tepida]|uniref:4Fe-4S ferredoxin n=1 Tax=Blastochloris tepida TaxID=2233851 RepID=A0A348FZS2_9HYPH|nr:4Fe-4S dicluster domain-containing protein [Blastochloris tepida]BBF92805.1 4Fe-4S ferredoxin [Blastochloris tepida]